MKHGFLFGALLVAGASFAPLLLVPAPSPGAREPDGEPAPVRWRTDWEAARREANAARKPLFVVFRCER